MININKINPTNLTILKNIYTKNKVMIQKKKK